MQKELETYTVGEILHMPWGATMILHDFFQVEKVTPKSVYLRLLAKEERTGEIPFTTIVKPIKGQYKTDHCRWNGLYRKPEQGNYLWAKGKAVKKWDGKEHTEYHND